MSSEDFPFCIRKNIISPCIGKVGNIGNYSRFVKQPDSLFSERGKSLFRGKGVARSKFVFAVPGKSENAESLAFKPENSVEVSFEAAAALNRQDGFGGNFGNDFSEIFKSVF